MLENYESPILDVSLFNTGEGENGSGVDDYFVGLEDDF